MTDHINKEDFTRMIGGAAASIRKHHAMLSELDSASGDGDHGATMLRTVERLERAFSPETHSDLKTCLRDAGWSVLGVDGGASSSLLGTLFLGMADAPACADLAVIFEAGLAGVRKQTKAQPGDKTMMDALVPAVGGLRSAADARKSVIEALQEAAGAARAGAEATKNLTARYGRARYLGERTRGYQDPGAISMALMFEGFCSGFMEPKEEVDNA